MLELHAAGVSAKDIADRIAQPRPTVSKWLGANRWTAEKLPERAARLPDYAAYRTRIQTAANTLGLHLGELPPVPEASRQTLTAEQFAASLEMVIARDRSKTQHGRFLEHVAETLSLSYAMLRGWISTDGKLTKPSSSVRNLPGFAGQAARIAAAFEQLDQPELADALLGGVSTHQRCLTAELLAKVLQDLAQKPDQPMRTLALRHQLGETALIHAVGPRGAIRLSPERIAALPGYDEHVLSIRRALKALGQTEAAANLRPPTVDAAEFLQTCRQNFGALMAVVERMAADPTRHRADEAARVGLPAKLMPVLFDTRGALRPEADIHVRLRDVESHLRTSVADMLRRIATRHAGIAVAPLQASMKRIDLSYGTSTVPDRALVVQPESVDPGPNKPNRLERIYAGSADLVRAPRSFEPERPRQVLRWLSTVLKRQFPQSIEVQCYFDEASRKIVVTGNNGDLNSQIRRFLADGGLHRLLEADATEASDETAREVRHRGKLWRRMELKSGPDPAEDVLAAIAESRFVVPKRNATDKGSLRGTRLHAERRIKEHMEAHGGARLDPTLLAGTMRPCGTCASELELPPEAHRGPFWQSKSASVGVDTERLIAQNQAEGIGTSVTRTREGRLTFGVDTDSDSDLESAR